MAERVVFRQDKSYHVEFLASDPRTPEDWEVSPVQGLHEVTPYGMMLFSLASCTTQVVLTYAKNHGVDLDEVEIDVIYQREFKEDCENCQGIERYEEHIEEQIVFSGDLSEGEREKLLYIAHQCPIQKMYEDGIEIKSELRS